MEIRWKILIAYCKVKGTDDAMGVIYKGGNLLNGKLRREKIKSRQRKCCDSPTLAKVMELEQRKGIQLVLNQLPGTSGPDHCSALYILLVKE